MNHREARRVSDDHSFAFLTWFFFVFVTGQIAQKCGKPGFWRDLFSFYRFDDEALTSFHCWSIHLCECPHSVPFATKRLSVERLELLWFRKRSRQSSSLVLEELLVALLVQHDTLQMRIATLLCLLRLRLRLRLRIDFHSFAAPSALFNQRTHEHSIPIQEAQCYQVDPLDLLPSIVRIPHRHQALKTLRAPTTAARAVYPTPHAYALH